MITGYIVMAADIRLLTQLYVLVFVIRAIIICPLRMHQQIPIVAALPEPERKAV